MIQENEDLTEFLKARLNTEVSTSLSSDSKKYICDSIPDREEVEPANVRPSCLASDHRSYKNCQEMTDYIEDERNRPHPANS